jgi:hypothetical protein
VASSPQARIKLRQINSERRQHQTLIEGERERSLWYQLSITGDAAAAAANSWGTGCREEEEAASFARSQQLPIKSIIKTLTPMLQLSKKDEEEGERE